MGIRNKPLGLQAILGSSVIVVLVVLLLHATSNEVLAVLMAWALGSIPLGILIGHCVLGED